MVAAAISRGKHVRSFSPKISFWQETNTRLQEDPASPLSTNPGLKTTAVPLASPLGMASPVRCAAHPFSKKPVECMGINHIKANQVAFAKVEIETGFYSEGTGKIVQEVGMYTYLLRIIPQNIDKEAGDFIYFEMKKTAVLALHPPLMMMDIERKNDMNVLCLVQPKP
ncbi:unnamed protein product [Brassica oleracea var. botrytis]